MSRLIQIAWLLPSLTLIGIAARTAIADVADRKQRHGRSWESRR